LDWIEASVQADGEAAEAISELMNRYVPGGVVIECDPGAPDALTVKAFLPPDQPETRHKIEEGLWHLGQIYPIPGPRFRLLPHQEWAEAWKRDFQVLHVGRRVVVKPSWLDYPPVGDEMVVELDPGMAFGTGLHPSTRLCIRALEEVIRPGVQVLDMGTGSGILAIAAALMGAEGVLALDLDPLAVKAATANAAANGVTRQVRVAAGSLNQLSDAHRFDLMLVNIVARVILELLDGGLLSHLRPGGWFVGAGILQDQAGDVTRALEARGLGQLRQRREVDWVAIVGHRA
jgi:ribosomal protein L11 methyltransferase